MSGQGSLQNAIPLPVCHPEAEHMKPGEYRQMSDEQLNLAQNELVKNLFHLRFQSATDRLETPSEMLKAKRELARIKTIIRERQLGKQREQKSPSAVVVTGRV